MRKFFVFIIVVLVLAWAAQSLTSVKVIDYAKALLGKISWSSLHLSKPTPTPADKQLNIFVRDIGFVPSHGAIIKGSRVTWYNEDDKPHTVSGTNWGSPELAPGQSYSRAFDLAGEFDYRCSLNPDMTGKIIVE